MLSGVIDIISWVVSVSVCVSVCVCVCVCEREIVCVFMYLFSTGGLLRQGLGSKVH